MENNCIEQVQKSSVEEQQKKAGKEEVKETKGWAHKEGVKNEPGVLRRGFSR